MVILYTHIYFKHNTFIMKYVYLMTSDIEKMSPNLIKGPEFSKGTMDFVFVFEHSIIVFKNNFNY